MIKRHCQFPKLCKYRTETGVWKPKCDGKTLCDWAKYLQDNHIRDIKEGEQ